MLGLILERIYPIKVKLLTTNISAPDMYKSRFKEKKRFGIYRYILQNLPLSNIAPKQLVYQAAVSMGNFSK